MDFFTRKRLTAFIAQFRKTKATYPTERDLEEAGFTRDLIARALKEELLEQLYVTMTTGAVVKVYKPKND